MLSRMQLLTSTTPLMYVHSVSVGLFDLFLPSLFFLSILSLLQELEQVLCQLAAGDGGVAGLVIEEARGVKLHFLSVL